MISLPFCISQKPILAIFSGNFAISESACPAGADLAAEAEKSPLHSDRVCVSAGGGARILPRCDQFSGGLYAENLEEVKLTVIGREGFLPVEGTDAPAGASIARIPLVRGEGAILRNYCAF